MVRSPGSFMTDLVAVSDFRSGLARRDDQRRAAGSDDVHGLRARGAWGAAISASHCVAAIGDARRAVVAPRQHLDFLPDVEAGLRRRHRMALCATGGRQSFRLRRRPRR